MDRHGQMAKQGLLDKRGLTSDTQNNPEPVPDPRTGSGLFEQLCGIVGMSVHCAVFRHLPMFRHFTCTLSDIRVPLQLCKLWVRSFFVGTTIVHPWVEKVWTLDNLSYPMEPATLSTLCPQMMDRFGICFVFRSGISRCGHEAATSSPPRRSPHADGIGPVCCLCR